MFRELIELGVVEIDTEPLDAAWSRPLTPSGLFAHSPSLVNPSRQPLTVSLSGLSAVLHKSDFFIYLRISCLTQNCDGYGLLIYNFTLIKNIRNHKIVAVALTAVADR
jgi:hypothetical protein